MVFNFVYRVGQNSGPFLKVCYKIFEIGSVFGTPCINSCRCLRHAVCIGVKTVNVTAVLKFELTSDCVMHLLVSIGGCYFDRTI